MAKIKIEIANIPKEVFWAIEDRMERLTNRIDSSKDPDEIYEAKQELEVLIDFYNQPEETVHSIDFIAS
jgi:hypothetical protein